MAYSPTPIVFSPPASVISNSPVSTHPSQAETPFQNIQTSQGGPSISQQIEQTRGTSEINQVEKGISVTPVRITHDNTIHSNNEQPHSERLESDNDSTHENSPQCSQHTQPEHIMNNPSEYLVADSYHASGVEDSVYKFDDSLNICPKSTVRVGRTLHIVYPLSSFLRCAESACDFKTYQKEWHGKKAKLLTHLKRQHLIKIERIQKWCNICKAPLHDLYQVTRHSCHKNCEQVQTTPEEYLELPFKCLTCQKYAFPIRVFRLSRSSPVTGVNC